MVWVHGGAFENGMGSSETYDGSALAAKGVVVVTINYRLGVFGFLAHPGLTAESSNGSSGNFGLEDQLAALRWVQSNIAAFGGNPNNVTIFGQSAGGASVRALLSSPQSRGLFHRAIIQSGISRSGLSGTDRAQAEDQGLVVAGDLTIAQMRSLSTGEVIERATAAKREGVRFGPVIDDYVITASAPAETIGIPGGSIELLVGNNSREGFPVPSDEELDRVLAEAFGPNVDRARAAYGITGSRPEAGPLLGSVAERFATDASFRCGTTHFANKAATAGVPIWQYQFEHFVPGKEERGAAHSFEVPYVFGNLSSTGFSAADYDADDRQLSELLTSYWTNFAKRGDPNGAGLPEWPRYTPANNAYLRLSSDLPDSAQAAAGLGGEICELFVQPDNH